MRKDVDNTIEDSKLGVIASAPLIVDAADTSLESASTTQQYESKILRKIDIALLPFCWLCYLLSFLDRTNIGKKKYISVYSKRILRLFGPF